MYSLELYTRIQTQLLLSALSFTTNQITISITVKITQRPFESYLEPESLNSNYKNSVSGSSFVNFILTKRVV